VTYAVGDRLTPGTTFARVIDQKTMQIEGVINQAESSFFRVGQGAIVRLDAYPGVIYRGKVHSIGALAAATGRSQYYIRAIPIRIQIENPDKLVIPDLSGSADILLDREDGALIVPSSAVQTEHGKSYIQVRAGQGVEKREVIVGATNGTQTSIREGLKEGEAVVVN
jgi:multidrug efflux pump subunit AcrA (membrane-fusion protein)